VTAMERPRCWDCGGPCGTHKGSQHGWRCRVCVDRYLDAAAAKADAKVSKERAKLAVKPSRVRVEV
jgi:tRNA(Ile2) C34 agmatinyltransferase TiaS